MFSTFHHDKRRVGAGSHATLHEALRARAA
eukprot:SAG22_NODE_5187_length_1067_cov_1.738636_1_plen_29_part_10